MNNKICKGFERKSNLRERPREEPPWAGSGSVMNAGEVHPGAGSVNFRRLPEFSRTRVAGVNGLPAV